MNSCSAARDIDEDRQTENQDFIEEDGDEADGNRIDETG